jgi:prepilin-type N-terminal cleavage/methylation domain-containing protein
MKNHQKPKTAFTLIELLVVIAVLALLWATLLPALAASKTKAEKINCILNLKQLGLAYSSWALSYNGRNPQSVLASQGGAQDYCTHGGNNSSTGTLPSIAYNPGMVYMVMSNYLLTPKLLFCPADTIHVGAATNFSYNDLLSVPTPVRGANAAALSASTKVSYFVGADAGRFDPQSILAGDFNIGNVGTLNDGASTTRFGSTVSAILSAPEITSASFGTGLAWAWTASDLHQKTGNLLIADGSVQSTTIIGLHTFMQNATNTVLGPCWNFLP